MVSSKSKSSKEVRKSRPVKEKCSKIPFFEPLNLEFRYFNPPLVIFAHSAKVKTSTSSSPAFN